MKRGRTPKSVVARGVCPVCRAMISLLNRNGMLAKHGRTAAAPAGCAGSYQAPMRTASGKASTSGTVVGFKAGEDGPTARQEPERAQDLDELDVPVVQRHPTKDWRTVRPPDGPATA